MSLLEESLQAEQTLMQQDYCPHPKKEIWTETPGHRTKTSNDKGRDQSNVSIALEMLKPWNKMLGADEEQEQIIS